MAHSNQAIKNLFDALEGVFPENTLRSRGLLEDMPTTLLEAEFSDDPRFDKLPEFMRQTSIRG